MSPYSHRHSLDRCPALERSTSSLPLPHPAGKRSVRWAEDISINQNKTQQVHLRWTRWKLHKCANGLFKQLTYSPLNFCAYRCCGSKLGLEELLQNNEISRNSGCLCRWTSRPKPSTEASVIAQLFPTCKFSTGHFLIAHLHRSCEMEDWSWIVTLIICVIGVVGNGAVIFLVVTRRRLHKTPNWFVLSLALADFLLGALYGPSLVITEGNEGSVVKIISKSFIIYLSGASITNLCAMTRDRYVAIVHPLWYGTHMGKKQVCLLLSVAWIFPLFRPVLNFVGNKKTLPYTVMLDSILYMIVPCVVMILATARILSIVRRHSRQTAAIQAQLRHNYPLRSSRETLQSPSQTVPSPKRDANSVKATVIVTGICTCYLISKIAVMVVLARSVRLENIEPVYPAVFVFMLLNSAANPFAYAFFKRTSNESYGSGFVAGKPMGNEQNGTALDRECKPNWKAGLPTFMQHELYRWMCSLNRHNLSENKKNV